MQRSIVLAIAIAMTATFTGTVETSVAQERPSQEPPAGTEALLLYGTTEFGGSSTACENGCGTLFELKTTGGAEELRFSFSGTRGSLPEAAPLLYEGVLYGTTSSSTNTSEDGVAFSITP